MQDYLKEQIREVKRLATVPMKTEHETKRVEIIMLKFKEEPHIINDAINRVINNTKHPFKLTVYDNRPNTANTSRIWNKLVKEATCEYVVLIDSDAFVPEYEVCWLTRMMESIHETGVVVPVGDNVGGAHQKAHQEKPYGAQMLNNGVWSGYCFLFKKKLALSDPFDENFYIYGQDSDWATRHPAVMREDVFVKHLGSYSFETNPLRQADKILARALFQKKCQK
jgi:hypothetical protein